MFDEESRIHALENEIDALREEHARELARLHDKIRRGRDPERGDVRHHR